MQNPFLRQHDNSGSFLPKDYVKRKAELRANVICLTLFGVVMFGIVSAFFVTNRQWLQVKNERQAITVQYTQEAARIDQLKKLQEQKSEMLTKAEITTALNEKVGRSALMGELVSRMPENMALLELHLISKRIREPVAVTTPTGGKPGAGQNQIRSLATSGQRGAAASGAAPVERVTAPRFEYTLKINGVAHVNNEVADYLAALKACRLLDRVELKYIKQETIDKQEFRKFEIEAMLHRDADTRGLEPVQGIRQAMDPVAAAQPAGDKHRTKDTPITTAVPPKGGE
jgi:Tfp pilus assembly protein PilN